MREITSLAREGGPPPIHPDRFREILSRSESGSEFFLPPDQAHWQGHRFTLGDGMAGRPPEISGVRFQEGDPTRQNLSRERACQTDLSGLVQKLMRLRSEPGLNGLVLSDEILLGAQPGMPGVKRAKFGLICPPDGRFRGDTEAAQETHGRIEQAISKAGFRVEDPHPFDPRTGLSGLDQWARTVRLHRKSSLIPPWLWILLAGLVLLAILGLVLLMRGCGQTSSPAVPSQPSPERPKGKEGSFFEPTTDSFILIIDKSASMDVFFPFVRREAQRLFQERRARVDKSYASLIFYDGTAKSSLDGIFELTDDLAKRILSDIDPLRAAGGTRLEAAIQMAAKEIIAHGKPTTLVILTDGIDTSIKEMNSRIAGVKDLFGPVPIKLQGVMAYPANPEAAAKSATWEPAFREFCLSLDPKADFRVRKEGP